MPADRLKEKSGSGFTPLTMDSKMSISVVKIPCNDKEPYTEVKVPIPRTKEIGDQLAQLLRIYFKDNSSVSMEAVQGAAAKQFSNQAMTISEATLRNTETSVETFPLSHPNLTNKQRRVNLYLDEAGQLKDLPVNSRASSIAAMCGFENVPFVGDMFIGRVLVGPAGVANVDFFLSEVDSSALWLKDIKRLNYEHGIKTNRVTMDPEKDAGLWNPDSTKGTDDSKGLSWVESDESMDVSITLPKEFQTIAAKNIKVTFQTKHLTVKVQNNTDSVINEIAPNAMLTLISAPMAGSIRPDECSWSIDKSGAPPKLEITMEKTEEKMWGKLTEE